MCAVFVFLQIYSLVINYFFWDLKIMLGRLLFCSMFLVLAGLTIKNVLQGLIFCSIFLVLVGLMFCLVFLVLVGLNIKKILDALIFSWESLAFVGPTYKMWKMVCHFAHCFLFCLFRI
jgi:hypothetical protein